MELPWKKHYPSRFSGNCGKRGFSRDIFLGKHERAGIVEGIYDENGNAYVPDCRLYSGSGGREPEWDFPEV